MAEKTAALLDADACLLLLRGEGEEQATVAASAGVDAAKALATGPGGTVVQLEKWLRPEEHPEPVVPTSWQRL